MFHKLSSAELSENTRWQERYGEPMEIIDVVFLGDSVRMGDEVFKIADLERAHIENPQPKSHPFKPHHYLVQEAMDDLKAFYNNYPDRKPTR